jgi:L-amino acid N-acyltransferase YncA
VNPPIAVLALGKRRKSEWSEEVVLSRNTLNRERIMETVLELNEEYLGGRGCYCLRSKPDSLGYQNKNLWLAERFAEGLKYLKVLENGKQAGFIEYAPIEFSSRVVHGVNYLVIHCLWVHVTGKGYASQLIGRCLEEARQQQKAGVIVITNPETSWTPSADIFIKHGLWKKGEPLSDSSSWSINLGMILTHIFPMTGKKGWSHFRI